MAEYPDHLLPRQHYRLIDDVGSLIDRHLLRYSLMPREEFLDEMTGLPRPTQLEINYKNVKDLSTSLLGTFTPQDYQFEVVGPRRQYLTYDPWKPGESVDPPNPSEFIVRSVSFVYHLPVALVQGFSFSYDFNGQTYEATCKARHTPVRANSGTAPYAASTI